MRVLIFSNWSTTADYRPTYNQRVCSAKNWLYSAHLYIQLYCIVFINFWAVTISISIYIMIYISKKSNLCNFNIPHDIAMCDWQMMFGWTKETYNWSCEFVVRRYQFCFFAEGEHSCLNFSIRGTILTYKDL